MAFTRRRADVARGPEARQEDYHARYTEFKQQGKPFWPHIIIEDVLVSLAVLVGLLLLAVFWGVPLEERADPTNSAYVPRPEWYFMWVFQLLKVFPGYLEWVGVAALPAIGLILLLFLPFLDRNPRRLPRFRLLALSLGSLGMIGVAFLTYQAFATTASQEGAIGPPGQEMKLTADQLAGRQLYNSQCAVCHSLGGEGGTSAPPLDDIVHRMDPAFIHMYIEDPKSINPYSTMPPYLKYPDVKLLTHQQMEQIVGYLMAYGEVVK